MVVKVKARGRSHSLLYVQGAQRRDRPPGPFRTYNFKVDRVLASTDWNVHPVYNRRVWNLTVGRSKERMEKKFLARLSIV